jgi:hypothetical protein
LANARKIRARRLRGSLPDLSHSRADAALDVNWPRRASIFSFTATVVQEQFLGASSPTPSRAPLFEVLEDFLFGDSFGGESRPQPRGCFLERGAICSAPSAAPECSTRPYPRGAQSLPARRSRGGSRRVFSKFSNADFERFHYGLLCTCVYTLVPLIVFRSARTLVL